MNYEIKDFKNGIKYQFYKIINAVDLPNDEIEGILNEYYKINKKFKFQLHVLIRYTRFKNDDEEEFNCKLSSKTETIINKENIDTSLENQTNYINEYIRERELNESNWVFNKVVSVRLDIFQYQSLVGGTFIKLPFISSKILNIVNKDNKCFVWCVLAYLHPIDEHSNRVTKYEKYNKL